MSGASKIEWTDATLFGMPLPKRCSKCRQLHPIEDFPRDVSRSEGRSFVCWRCAYERLTDMSRPGVRARRRMRGEGLAWCNGCRAWLDMAAVRRGLCKACTRAKDRAAYADHEHVRERAKNRRDVRRRGVERMPVAAREMLSEFFDGECAYCDAPATSWDHFVPVTMGGQTVPGNMLPACRSCNSRKKNRNPEAWLDIAPAVKVSTIEYLTMAGVL